MLISALQAPFNRPSRSISSDLMLSSIGPEREGKKQASPYKRSLRVFCVFISLSAKWLMVALLLLGYLVTWLLGYLVTWSRLHTCYSQPCYSKDLLLHHAPGW